MVKKIDTQRRERLANITKTAAAIAALSFLPRPGYSANLNFAPNNSSTSTLQLGNNGNVGIGGVAISTHRLKVYGNITADKVYNAVWNDLAEFRSVKKGETKIPGKAYVMSEEGLKLSTKKAEKGTVGIYSDTFGYALGAEDPDNKISIGISGWVLAYVDKKYSIGTELVAGKNGVLTKASLIDKLIRSTRIIGIVETSPASYNDLKIDGRYWVKII